jgi:hypothetical protein
MFEAMCVALVGVVGIFFIRRRSARKKAAGAR